MRITDMSGQNEAKKFHFLSRENLKNPECGCAGGLMVYNAENGPSKQSSNSSLNCSLCTNALGKSMNCSLLPTNYLLIGISRGEDNRKPFHYLSQEQSWQYTTYKF